MMLFVQLDRIETVVKASGHHRLSRMIKLHGQIEAARTAFLGDSFEASQVELLQQAPALLVISSRCRSRPGLRCAACRRLPSPSPANCHQAR